MIDRIEKANESGYLWPPISDAVDTYLRRRSSNADGYELTWRLIHVWEAIVITLAAAMTTRLRGHVTYESLFRRCREHYHGRTWSGITDSFNRSSGGLDGSATRRIDVLWDVSNSKETESQFHQSVRDFLLAEAINLGDLVNVWARICDVPMEARATSRYSVRDAMRHINTFRNRFAHVPFPYDVMNDVATALAGVTEQLFTIEPHPSSVFPSDTRLESPLCGSLLWNGRAMRGNSAPRAQVNWTSGCAFCYPAYPKKSAEPETWSAAPFMYVDSMVRPYVMTRLKSEASGSWEFTRFRAEANSVVTIEEPSWLAQLPEPQQSEYATAQDSAERAEAKEIEAEASSPPSPSAIADGSAEPDSFDEALRFIRNEEYAPAIRYLSRYTELRPGYHNGWLRLGHAQRELAMRTRVSDTTQSLALFEDAIHSLTRAAEHSDSNRRAQAYYERSKAHFHRGKVGDRREDFRLADEDAQEAYQLSPDTSYETWREYIRRNTPQATPKSVIAS